MSVYNPQLLKALIDEGWELIERNEENMFWWCDEYWTIRSIRENWGLELFILFLVDPQWDAPRKKGQGIWAITATEKFPENRSEASQGIALLCMSKRKFDTKLKEFIASVNEYRRKFGSAKK
jgi:hypothetical protein